MRNRIVAGMLCLIMALVCLVSCAEETKVSRASTLELVEKATENLICEFEIVSNEPGADADPFDEIYYTHYYGAQNANEFFENVSSYTIAKQTGVSANEIGVFKINTEIDEEAFRASNGLTGDALERAVETERESIVESRMERVKNTYCRARVQIFLNQTENYDREEYAKAQNALVSSHGNYVYYILATDNAAIERIIVAQIDAKRI